MRSAQEALSIAIGSARIGTPSGLVAANTTATAIDRPETIRAELTEQLCGCVLWQQSVELMAREGVDRFIEFGPGKVLTGLIRRIAPDASAVAVPDIDSMSALAIS
jgi:[acyl-carrier-protein] S-malonyltransferase